MRGIEIFGIHLLTALFFAGLLGSSVVVLVSFFEDLHELFSSDVSDAPAAPQARQ